MRKQTLLEARPDLAAQWHPTKNGDLKPSDVTAYSTKKVWWICEQGHEWQAKIRSRYETGCPVCARKKLKRKIVLHNGSLQDKAPALAAQWHPTKNGELKPSDVTAFSAQKVWWICDKGHEWPATVANRSQGNKCPYCSGRMKRKVYPSGQDDLETVKPKMAAQWHPTKNGDLKPSDVKWSSKKKAWWICKNGHEWQASIYTRNEKRTCPICSGSKILVGYNDLETINPALAVQWHPTKNGDLKPSDVTAGSGKKVWWLCEKGHEWEARIADRNRGSGCPYCYWGK